MSDNCQKCGAPLGEEGAVCSVCGHSPEKETENAQATVQPPQPQQDAREQAQSKSQSAQGAPARKVEEDKATATLSTGAFWGLMLLFAIPIIGLISAFIMIFACKNKNIKHFALATFIWKLIGIIFIAIVAAAAYFIFTALYESVRITVSEILGIPADTADLNDVVKAYAEKYGVELPEDFELPKDFKIPKNRDELNDTIKKYAKEFGYELPENFELPEDFKIPKNKEELKEELGDMIKDYAQDNGVELPEHFELPEDFTFPKNKEELDDMIEEYAKKYGVEVPEGFGGLAPEKLPA